MPVVLSRGAAHRRPASGSAAEAALVSGANGLVPIGASHLALVPSVPTDVLVGGPRGPLLYAVRGSRTGPLLERIELGLKLWITSSDLAVWMQALLAVMARAGVPGTGRDGDAGRSIRTAIRGLLELAASGRARESVDIADPCLVGLVAAATTVESRLQDPAIGRAVLEAPRMARGERNAAVERIIDGAVLAAAILECLRRNADVELGPGDQRSLVAAMLVRDIALIRSSDRALGHRHPEVAVELLNRAGLRGSTLVRLVRRHHERPDGSGYPMGLRGDELSDLDLVVGAADALAGVLAFEGIVTRARSDALSAARFIVGARFPARIAAATLEAVAQVVNPLAVDDPAARSAMGWAARSIPGGPRPQRPA